MFNAVVFVTAIGLYVNNIIQPNGVKMKWVHPSTYSESSAYSIR